MKKFTEKLANFDSEMIKVAQAKDSLTAEVVKVNETIEEMVRKREGATTLRTPRSAW